MRRFLLTFLTFTLILMTAYAQAATYNVDTTIDAASLTTCNDATPNDCSLRGAIIKANGLSTASTINVPAGTYVLSQGNECTFNAPQLNTTRIPNTASLCFAGNISLIGAGATSTIINGNTSVVPI